MLFVGCEYMSRTVSQLRLSFSAISPNETATFTCPFVGCEYKSHKKHGARIRKHVMDQHGDLLSESLSFGLNPATQAQAKAQQKKRLREDLGIDRTSQREQNYVNTYESYSLPGVFGHFDNGPELQAYGVGQSIWGSRHLSFDTDKIPVGILDKDWNLISQ